MPFIYALRDPRDWTIRYVGRAVFPEQRFNGHVRKGAPRIRTWVSELRLASLKPELVLLEECPHGQVYRVREHHWIEHYRKEFPLYNTQPAISPEERHYLKLP